MQTTSRHLWGIILAGGDGRRLQPFIKARFGYNRPKQYCTFHGTQSMLRQTIDRAERLVRPTRLLTIITQDHLCYAEAELADRPPTTVILQPCNRETGPGIFLPLLHVQQRDPQALVVLLPSDHFVVEEERFMEAVAAAVTWVNRYPERPVLLGIAPLHPEIDYGWIETGEDLGWAQGEVFYQVRRFWEKPGPIEAQRLLEQGCLWNTMVVVGSVEALIALFHRQTPQLVAAFMAPRSTLGSPQESDALAEVYAQLPAVNFSQAILAPSSQHLAVLPVEGVYWSDWGNPQRLLLDLTRFAS